MAIKVKKHTKNKRSFSSSYSRPSIQTKPFAHLKPETASKEDKSKDKVKEIEFPKNLNVRDASNAKDMVTFKLTDPNKRGLTIREIEEID